MFLHGGGVVCRGVDMLLLGFDPVVLPGVAWAWSSLLSLKGRFVPCGCYSQHRTSIATGPSPILYLFSRNLAPPLVQPLFSSKTFALSLEIMPIYPLPSHASSPFRHGVEFSYPKLDC